MLRRGSHGVEALKVVFFPPGRSVPLLLPLLYFVSLCGSEFFSLYLTGKGRWEDHFPFSRRRLRAVAVKGEEVLFYSLARFTYFPSLNLTFDPKIVSRMGTV